MGETKATVLIIDDDPAIRRSLSRLLRSVGLDAQLFESIPDFLQAKHPNGPNCLVLDVNLPGQSGLDLQRELVATNRQIPIIFITGHGDIPMTVKAMKGGAIEFLMKPFQDQDLLDAVQLGLARDRVRREHEDALRTLKDRLESLTPREREIMIHVAQGSQQAGRGRYRDQRAHGESPSQQLNAEDESGVATGACPNGG